MAARLGQVLYWTACFIAVAFLLFAIMVYFTSGRVEFFPYIVLSVLAALSYGIGRACRYVLSGY